VILLALLNGPPAGGVSLHPDREGDAKEDQRSFQALLDEL
jgi:hypothetical protein